MATQDIALSPAAETSLPLTARLHELVVTVDHKKLGLMYIGSALFFFVVAGSMASVIRMQLALPNNNLIWPGDFQPSLYHARHSDGLSPRHADYRRADELSGAVDDWRARYGFPPTQRVRFLDVPLRRACCSMSATWLRRD